MIAAVGLRLVAIIPPHLEQGDHLRYRQFSAMLLIASAAGDGADVCRHASGAMGAGAEFRGARDQGWSKRAALD